MLKISHRLLFLFFVISGFLSCSKYNYKNDNSQVVIQEDYSFDEIDVSTIGASSIEKYRNDENVLSADFQDKSNSIKYNVKQLNSCINKNESIAIKSRANNSINVKSSNSYVLEKQKEKIKKTELYDNLSVLSTALGVFSVLFSLIVPNLGVFLGAFTVILGLLGFWGINTKKTSKFKKSIRFAVLGIFLGLLAIVFGVTIMLI